jgi:hypothetical protein
MQLALRHEASESERSIFMNGKWKQTMSLAGMLIGAALLTVFLPQRAAADQNDPPGRVARLKYVQGAVSFQPAGEPDWVSAVANRPMTTGDKLWADTGARAELRIGSATIRLDSSTGFSFLNLDDRTVQLQLTQGTLDIRVQRLGSGEIFEVDTPNQAFSILRPGQYRVQASEDGNSTFVTVRSGEGEATGGGQTYSVRSGERGTFTGTDSISADVVSAGGTDQFDNWGETRDRHDDASRSTRYVSPDVVGYEDLDDNGSWRDDPAYGNVWAPRVSSGWAPYHDGHWAWISPWGWTWVDDAPWGYAPFHYGRWVSSRGDWCWVPGPIAIEPVYAPALVAFIGGSNFGVSISVGGGGYGDNVGWFPLGPREVYVPGYNTSRGYVDHECVQQPSHEHQQHDHQQHEHQQYEHQVCEQDGPRRGDSCLADYFCQLTTGRQVSRRGECAADRRSSRKFEDRCGPNQKQRPRVFSLECESCSEAARSECESDRGGEGDTAPTTDTVCKATASAGGASWPASRSARSSNLACDNSCPSTTTRQTGASR